MNAKILNAAKLTSSPPVRHIATVLKLIIKSFTSAIQINHAPPHFIFRSRPASIYIKISALRPHSPK